MEKVEQLTSDRTNRIEHLMRSIHRADLAKRIRHYQQKGEQHHIHTHTLNHSFQSTVHYPTKPSKITSPLSRITWETEAGLLQKEKIWGSEIIFTWWFSLETSAFCWCFYCVIIHEKWAQRNFIIVSIKGPVCNIKAVLTYRTVCLDVYKALHKEVFCLYTPYIEFIMLISKHKLFDERKRSGSCWVQITTSPLVKFPFLSVLNTKQETSPAVKQHVNTTAAVRHWIHIHI